MSQKKLIPITYNYILDSINVSVICDIITDYLLDDNNSAISYGVLESKYQHRHVDKLLCEYMWNDIDNGDCIMNHLEENDIEDNFNLSKQLLTISIQKKDYSYIPMLLVRDTRLVLYTYCLLNEKSTLNTFKYYINNNKQFKHIKYNTSDNIYLTKYLFFTEDSINFDRFSELYINISLKFVVYLINIYGEDIVRFIISMLINDGMNEEIMIYIINNFPHCVSKLMISTISVLQLCNSIKLANIIREKYDIIIKMSPYYEFLYEETIDKFDEFLYLYKLGMTNSGENIQSAPMVYTSLLIRHRYETKRSYNDLKYILGNESSDKKNITRISQYIHNIYPCMKEPRFITIIVSSIDIWKNIYSSKLFHVNNKMCRQVAKLLLALGMLEFNEQLYGTDLCKLRY